MQESFWQQDWFVWGAVLIIVFPFATLMLGEIIYRAKAKDKLLELLAELAQSASNRYFGKGEKAIAQGMQSDEFYVIVKGQAIVTIGKENSIKEIELAKLSEGDFFGESALSGKNISGVTVTALSDLELLILPIDKYRQH